MRNGFPLNNNRNQNNRRRGRGNRNQGGGGSQANRIDSRARGNAPQLLDKYKKLAEDAHRNGDRVQAEYYLQFADHYFRVIADNRARQDEQRGGSGEQRNWRRDERDSDEFDGSDEDEGIEPRDTREPREQREQREPRDNREQREPRRERPRRDRDGEDGRPRRDRNRDEAPAVAVEASEGPAYEPQDNPFTRDTRDEREAKPKRRAPRSRTREEDNGEGHGIDAAVLPPSLSANDSGDDSDAGEEAPRPRRRKRGEGGTLSAVG